MVGAAADRSAQHEDDDEDDEDDDEKAATEIDTCSKKHEQAVPQLTAPQTCRRECRQRPRRPPALASPGHLWRRERSP